MDRMASRASKAERRGRDEKTSVSITEARRLVAIIEKSQVPYGESAPEYARIKAWVDAGKVLSSEDFEHLMGLVKKAQDWEKAVQSSARTLPEETLPG